MEWSFNNIEDIDYILLGKWTQDAEEHFFGRLRHASTRNFHSSPLQFKESMKKLRDRRILSWISENDSGYLKQRVALVADHTPTFEAITALYSTLDTDYYDEVAEKLDPETMHVAGYAAAKLAKYLSKELCGIKNCDGCASLFVAAKGDFIIDNDYHSYLQRGGLVVATPLANIIVNHLEVSFSTSFKL